MIAFKPIEENGIYGYIAVDETEVGKCLFKINGLYVDITAVTAVEELIAEGLIRAALNFAANRSCYIARCAAGLSDNVLSRMKFTLKDGLYSAEIPEALTGCCH